MLNKCVRPGAASQAVEIEAVKSKGCPNVPFLVLLDRYAREVTPTKRSSRVEFFRLGRLMRDDLAMVRLPCLSSVDLAAWRDRRLSQVSSASVLREMTLLSHVFTVAVNEWRLLRDNPLRGVRKPRAPLPRDRRITDDEIAHLLLAFGYRRDIVLESITSRVGAAFLFAIETGMRLGEICSLRWDAISGVVAHLPITKNGFPRDVPMSVEALRIIGQLPRLTDFVFGLNVSQVDSLFRKARSRAMIEDLHFHDTRHEAITRLAHKLVVLDLARMVGVRDLRILMIYYNAKPAEIAARLDSL